MFGKLVQLVCCAVLGSIFTLVIGVLWLNYRMKTRGLGILEATSGYVLKNAQGTRLAGLIVDPNGNPALFLRSKDSPTGMVFYFRKGHPMMQMDDEHDIARLSMQISGELGGPTIALADEKGRVRATLGKIQTVLKSGANSLSPEGKLMFYDPKGNAIWEAPPLYEVRASATLIKGLPDTDVPADVKTSTDTKTPNAK